MINTGASLLPFVVLPAPMVEASPASPPAPLDPRPESTAVGLQRAVAPPEAEGTVLVVTTPMDPRPETQPWVHSVHHSLLRPPASKLRPSVPASGKQSSSPLTLTPLLVVLPLMSTDQCSRAVFYRRNGSSDYPDLYCEASGLYTHGNLT